MISNDHLIWSNGYKEPEDLKIGDPLRSLDPLTGKTVDDFVIDIEYDEVATSYNGFRGLCMNQLVSPDHPILSINLHTNNISRPTISSKMMTASQRNVMVIASPYKLYERNNDLEQVKWSARIAAVYAQHDLFLTDQDSIQYSKNLTGYEARVWLGTFMDWNVLRPYPTWMKTVYLRNYIVRDMIFDIAPRAGVGVHFSPYYWSRIPKDGMWVIKLTKNSHVYVTTDKWVMQRYEGPVFNITNNNGSILVLRKNGTFLVACKCKE